MTGTLATNQREIALCIKELIIVLTKQPWKAQEDQGQQRLLSRFRKLKIPVVEQRQRRELNNMSFQKQCELLTILIRNNESSSVNALLNLKAQVNFATWSLCGWLEIQWWQRMKTYTLRVYNEWLKAVAWKTTLLFMIIQQHHEKIIFDIVEKINYNIVLDIFWLKKHELIIMWLKRIFKMEICECIIIMQIMHQQNSMINEKKRITKHNSTLRKNDVEQQQINSTSHDKDQSNNNAKIIEENCAPFWFPYKNYWYLFKKETEAKALPKHQPWNHNIELKFEKSLTFKSIYQLSEKKLKVLRDYLNENLKKKFSQESQSSADYSILFISKWQFTLRVDYWKLNDIKIKNWYSLFNIVELRDNAKIFMALDLYNSDWMKADE